VAGNAASEGSVTALGDAVTSDAGSSRSDPAPLADGDDDILGRIDDLRRELLRSLETIDAIQEDLRTADLPASPAVQVSRQSLRASPGDIPDVALRAYLTAQDTIARDDPGCGLRWSLLAAIGKVESDHGRFGGAVLRADGYGTSPIRGIPLDGRPGVALIRDTDGGQLDGDTVHDRALGPMQFIPSSWRRVAVDGNADGRADPDNIFDAALGAAIYLCAGDANLRDPAHKASAVFRYNHSWEYVTQVLALAIAYEVGFEGPLPSSGVVPAPTPQLSTQPRAPATVDPSPASVGRSSSGVRRPQTPPRDTPSRQRDDEARAPVTTTTAPPPTTTTTSTTTTSTTLPPTTTTTTSTTTTTPSTTTTSTTTTVPEPSPSVVFNGVPLAEGALAELEAALGWLIAEGRYWYDATSGAVGIEAQGTAGFIAAGLDLGGALPADASSGTTGVFLNGRELPTEDLQQLEQLVFQPIAPGRYVLDAAGNYGAEGRPTQVNIFANLERSPDGDEIAAASSWIEGDRSSGYSFAAGSACNIMSATDS
jgi:hypothetical protein